MLRKLTAELHKELIENDKKFAILFWQPKCGSCHPAIKVVKSVSEELDMDNIYMCNTRENQKLIELYDIPKTPTLVTVIQGGLKKKRRGFLTLELAKNMLEEVKSGD
jgi:thiol-disulfide isomerase/thioredoxin